MQRDYRVYLDDIVEAVSRIRQYAPEIAALEDQKTLDAVVRNLEIIGEAVKRIPENIRGSIPRSTGGESPVCGTSSSTSISESTSISFGTSFSTRSRNSTTQSAASYEAPMSQRFTALRVPGIPSKLLTFPDEGHWVSKPGNSRLWHATVMDWLHRYLAAPKPTRRPSTPPTA